MALEELVVTPMNYKKILRLMRKFNLFAKVRRANSDQGVHYTNPGYLERVKKIGLLQSMSRRGNCLDNAPTESFFGNIKDEVDYQEAHNLFELKQIVDEFMEHFNKTRKQWNLKKMTPAQYRSHLIAA